MPVELPELTYPADGPSVALYLKDRAGADRQGRTLAVKLEGGTLELHDNWDWQSALAWDGAAEAWRLASGSTHSQVQIARFEGLLDVRLLVEVNAHERVVEQVELEGPLSLSSRSDTLYLRQDLGKDVEGQPAYAYIAWLDEAARSWRPSAGWPGDNRWAGALVFQAPLVERYTPFTPPVRDRVSPLAERGHVPSAAG